MFDSTLPGPNYRYYRKTFTIQEIHYWEVGGESAGVD